MLCVGRLLRACGGVLVWLLGVEWDGMGFRVERNRFLVAYLGEDGLWQVLKMDEVVRMKTDVLRRRDSNRLNRNTIEVASLVAGVSKTYSEKNGHLL